MKITTQQLKQIIKEELEEMRTAGPDSTAAVLHRDDDVDMRALAAEYRDAYLEPIFEDILKEYPPNENKEMTKIQITAFKAAMLNYANSL